MEWDEHQSCPEHPCLHLLPYRCSLAKISVLFFVLNPPLKWSPVVVDVRHPGVLVTSHLPANLVRRRSKERTEDIISPLFSSVWDRDFFQLLWSLFHSAVVIHTTPLASFCPQSFLTSSFLFFSFPLTPEHMNNSLWWSRLQKLHAWCISLCICQIGWVIWKTAVLLFWTWIQRLQWTPFWQQRSLLTHLIGQQRLNFSQLYIL